MTRSREELKSMSGYGQEAARWNWRKGSRPFRFPIDEYPKLNRLCPMECHRTAPDSTLDYLASRETELIQFSPESL